MGLGHDDNMLSRPAPRDPALAPRGCGREPIRTPRVTSIPLTLMRLSLLTARRRRAVSAAVALGVVAPWAASRAQVGAAPPGAPPPMATAPPVPRTGLRLPEIQLHDPWIVAE